MSDTDYAPCGECGGTVTPTQIRMEPWDDTQEPGWQAAGVCESCGETYFDPSSRKPPPSGGI